jgi:uncharacterized protein DUF5000/uncharacterized protein DUF4959/uncharacterized protein DUF5126
MYKYLLFLLIIINACEKVTKEPACAGGEAPALVNNVHVENRNGYAKIMYSVPEDSKILFVQADYIGTNGKPVETKVSYYVDSILVSGFADTMEHEIKLYSVSRCGTKSQPVLVKVKPKEAPIFSVFRSLAIENFFGGFTVTASNPTGENIGIVVLTQNSVKEYEVDNYKSIYLTAGERIIQAKVRGMDTLTQRLGFYVQDRYGNKTDTLFQNITPIYETELDKAKFKTYALPGDAPQVTNGARLEYAWDNRLGWPYVSFTDQTAGGPNPHMITFDLGITAKLSLIWIRPFPELSPQQFYFLTTLKRFELYGATAPSSNGALDGTWTLLNSFTVTKPSGTGYGKDTDLDRTIAAAGWNFEIPLNAPRVRFLRVRCLENWAGGTAQNINEISVYGDPR